MKKSFLYLFSALVALLLSTAAEAQTLKGVIFDPKGEPVIGAALLVRGTGTGTVTDLDGKFSLQVASTPSVVEVSAVGFRKEEIEIFEVSDEELEIQLSEDNNGLNEVVVVGYGTQKKSDLVGSVSTINVDKLKNNKTASFDGALAGSSAGLQATPTSGQPGGGISIRIRGGSSVQGGNEPLYVIDGFPIYNNSLSAGAVSGAASNLLANINPSDIESINILKDASATSIYGSRGANGVVIITTRRGHKGEKSNITYEGTVSWQSLRKKIDVLDAKEFASLRNDALYDTYPDLGKYQYLSQEEIDALGSGTDWQDEAFRTALLHSHQLSAVGGTEKVNYAISLGFFDQDGIIRNTDFKRFSARVNIDAQLTKRFALGLSLTGGRSTSNVAPSGIVNALILMPPTATIYNEDGSYTLKNPFENIFSNPIASLNEQTNKARDYKALGTVFGEWEIVKDLKLKLLFGVDAANRKEYNYVPSTIYEGASVGGKASIGSADSYSWLNENTLSYDLQKGKKHHFNFLAGFTQQEKKTEQFSSGSSDYVSDDFLFNNLSSGSNISTPSSNAQTSALISWLGRVSYDLKQRYYVTASLRADGSSRFGKDNKWGVFPSAGVSWIVSKERFFNDIKKSFSTLKFRTSYGVTGNQEIGNYQSLSTLSDVTYLFGDKVVIGYAPDRISNDELSWETTKQFDLGLDFGFFDDRLNLSADYYLKKTTDLLLDVEIPWSSGFSSSLQNYGSVQNHGFEFTISSKNIVRENFVWETNGNISFNRNKVTSLGGTSDQYISGSLYYYLLTKVGEPLGNFYGAVADGILQAGEEETKGVFSSAATPKPGDRLYKDINGDGKFTSGEDREIIGNAQPKFIFGLTNSFSFHGWDASFLIQGSIGGDIMNYNAEILDLYNGQQNASADAAARWTESNPSTSTPRAKIDPAPVFSDLYVEDGSFVRLKNLTIGYSLPKNVTDRLSLSGIRIYATGNNIATITNYSGFDPEVTTTDNTVSAGVDSGVYPVARSFGFGAIVNF